LLAQRLGLATTNAVVCAITIVTMHVF
jgi:hypothetical protein